MLVLFRPDLIKSSYLTFNGGNKMTKQVFRAVVFVISKYYVFVLLSCVYFIEVTLHKSI